MVTNDYKFSSNINEVIKTALSFNIFCKKILRVQKSTKPLTANKNNKMRIKNI